MKKLLTLLSLVTILCFGLSSCQKDIVFVDGSGPGSTAPAKTTISLSAKIEGKLTNFGNVAAQQVDAMGVMTVGGSTTTEGISILIADYKGAKVYDIESDGVLITYIRNGGADPEKDFFIGTTGKVTITSVNNKQVSGTFSCSAGNLDASNQKFLTFTDGKFTSSLTIQK